MTPLTRNLSSPAELRKNKQNNRNPASAQVFSDDGRVTGLSVNSLGEAADNADFDARVCSQFPWRHDSWEMSASRRA
jgi:hypothetical protein